MSKFKLEIETSNAAFGESIFERDLEIAAILTALAITIEKETYDDRGAIPLYDSNGNRVGEAQIVD